jgi:two-component system OmpR family sensor kinase
VRTGSLTRRVVLSTVALLLVVLVGLGVVVDLILSNRLHSDLRQRLTERARYASVLAGRGLVGQQLADALTGQGITGSVKTGGEFYVGRDRVVPPASGNGAGAGPFGGLGDFPGPRGGEALGGTAPTGSQVLVQAGAVTLLTQGTQLAAQVQIGNSALLLVASEADIDHTMDTLRTIELIAGAATLLIAAGLSITVVRTALAPLRRMSRLAHRIGAGERGRRLQPTRPHTDLGRTASAMDAMLDSLEDAEAKAQDAETRMRQFLADASHDMRTPLAVMLAEAEQLLRADPGRAKREARLVELIREGHRAARLVDDLLLMVRLDDDDPSAALRHDAVVLAPVVAAVVERGTLTLRDRAVRLDNRAPDLVISGDPDRLARVLTNLVDNAANATGPGGHITVVVAVQRSGAATGSAVVDVRDDGPGVPPHELGRVFDRFVRLDETRHGSGSGLGLPIARAIARAHGGDVICLPAERGAHFRLILPADAPRQDLLVPAVDGCETGVSSVAGLRG